MAPSLTVAAVPEVAARWHERDGFIALTTGVGFQNDMQTPWQEAGERIASLVGELYGRPPQATVFAGQVHSATVLVAGEGATGLSKLTPCDGLATAHPGILLVIRTADCLPIVLVDVEAGVCAALHSGWRGTYDNITAAGIETMVSLGARRERIRGWIGPAICGDAYEVSPEMIEQFHGRHGHLGSFTRGRLLDLPRLVQLQGKAAGLAPNAIEWCGQCTLSNPNLFHSHRRQGTVRGHEFTLCGFAK